MPEILHTRNHEEAARALAARYDRVLIRNKHILWKPIRLRRAAIADLEPRIVLNPQQFDSELDAWNKDGGVVMYDRAFKKYENIAAHHAQLLTECPISVEDLERYIEGTRELVVIFMPPHWREHERAVREFYPDARLCERFYRIAQRGGTPSAGVLAAMGAVEAGRMVSDADMAAALKVTTAQLGRIRRAMLRKREWKMVTPVVLRIEPEDATLAQTYRFIERECPKVDGAHLIVGTKLSKAIRHWRVALRALERRGAIARRDPLFFYLLDGLEPDWRRLAQRHEAGKARLMRMAQFMETTEELNPRALQSRRSPARPSRSLSTSAA